MEAAWMLKCQCLVRDNYIDELETEEEGIADALMQETDKNAFARVGTSFRNSAGHNPIMRPMSGGRVNTGFQRVGTSANSRAGSKQANMLRTGRVMTNNGVPATSNGRVLRLATASLQQHGENFFDASKADMRRIAQRRSKARVVFLYLFYVEHNLRKALELAVCATELNKFEDPWWKLSLAKCYYHLSFYPEAEKQLLSSVAHNNNIQSILYLSKIYQKQYNVQKSISALAQATTLHKYEPKLLIALGRIYDELGKF
jgi:tetratricopeptide repeat protein 8